MKKVKIAFWVIVFGFLALIIYQNQGYFLENVSLKINLFFAAYQLAEIPNILLFVAIFFIGLLLAYFFSLFERFKSNRIIKDLKGKIAAHIQKNADLQKEIENIRAIVLEQQAATEVQAESDNQPGNQAEPDK